MRSTSVFRRWESMRICSLGRMGWSGCVRSPARWLGVQLHAAVQREDREHPQQRFHVVPIELSLAALENVFHRFEEAEPLPVGPGMRQAS